MRAWSALAPILRGKLLGWSFVRTFKMFVDFKMFIIIDLIYDLHVHSLTKLIVSQILACNLLVSC